MLESRGEAAAVSDACVAVVATMVAAGSLRCTILSYEEPEDGDIEQTHAVVSVLEACPSLGLVPGDTATIAMCKHLAESARLIDDLLGGNPLVDVPACDPGSIIVFTGCTPGLDGTPVLASGFAVDHAESSHVEAASVSNATPKQNNSE